MISRKLSSQFKTSNHSYLCINSVSLFLKGLVGNKLLLNLEIGPKVIHQKTFFFLALLLRQGEKLILGGDGSGGCGVSSEQLAYVML